MPWIYGGRLIFPHSKKKAFVSLCFVIVVGYCIMLSSLFNYDLWSPQQDNPAAGRPLAAYVKHICSLQWIDHIRSSLQ